MKLVGMVTGIASLGKGLRTGHTKNTRIITHLDTNMLQEDSQDREGSFLQFFDQRAAQNRRGSDYTDRHAHQPEQKYATVLFD